MFVKAGYPIVPTGNSGRPTVLHLHLTVKHKRKAVNAKVLLDYFILHIQSQNFGVRA